MGLISVASLNVKLRQKMSDRNLAQFSLKWGSFEFFVLRHSKQIQPNPVNL